VLIQRISLTSSPRIFRPWKNLLLWKMGLLFRISISFLVNSKKALCLSSHSQFNQLISLSWQYTLLLPNCVRPYSSPLVIMGTPWLRRRVAIKFRFCCSLSALISGSSVGPSTPQFQLLLWLSPSLLSSPFASLCFSL